MQSLPRQAYTTQRFDFHTFAPNKCKVARFWATFFIAHGLGIGMAKQKTSFFFGPLRSFALTLATRKLGGTRQSQTKNKFFLWLLRSFALTLATRKLGGTRQRPNKKQAFSLAFALVCTNTRYAQVRRHSAKPKQKTSFFFGLCSRLH